MFVVRAAAKAFSGEALGRALLLQLGNMVGLYTAMALLNTRSRRRGSRAAQQVRRGGGHACRRHVGATTTAAAAHAAHVWLAAGLPRPRSTRMHAPTAPCC